MLIALYGLAFFGVVAALTAFIMMVIAYWWEIKITIGRTRKNGKTQDAP